MMRLIGLVLTVLVYTSTATAQENSPYSRYGLGDIAPSQNILSRGMGGIAAGVADFQTINFVNPASYATPRFYTTFDVGSDISIRTLKSTNPIAKFSARNVIISYIQLGFPIAMKKANKKRIFLGGNIGLRPVSNINYKIIQGGKVNGIDSTQTTYEGTGGLSQAYVGLGLKVRNFSIGFNTGYTFGNKNYSTGISFINDTASYLQSNSSNKTNFGSMFFNAGVQYDIVFKNKAKRQTGLLRLGAYGNLKQNLKATNDIVRETVQYDAAGNVYRVDSVYQKSLDGTIVLPFSYGFGFLYQDSSHHWTFGADYEATNWSDYRFYDTKDLVQNSYKIKVGAEYLPARPNTTYKKYFSFVRYRLGFYYGRDYVKPVNNLPIYGVTFGAGFPLKIRRAYYETQSSMLNTAIEIGTRGNNNNNLKENIVRISIGLSLSDIWFNRSKYN